MALKIYDTIQAQGDYPAVTADQVEMPDGSRLSDLTPAYPVLEGTQELQPDRFYSFGAVSALAVTLARTDDALAHEFCFEFVAAEDFSGFSVTPEPKWVSDPQIVPGKTHQVSVLRGIGVMVCA